MKSYSTYDYEFHDVAKLEILGDYTLKLDFDDGAVQIIDFKPILYGPLFTPLRNVELFNQVRLDEESGTIVWPTGADIDPNVLYNWPQHADAIIKRRQKQFVKPSGAAKV